jgi:hypothetical protein
MAYKQISPIPIFEGGTDAISFTPFSLIAAGTTSTGTLQNVGTGTAGQLLTSAGSSALPAWDNPAASSISITGNTGGALGGNAFIFSGGTTGLTFNGSGSTETLVFAGIVANNGVVSLGTDALDNAINIGTNANAGREITIGNVVGTSGINEKVGTGNFVLNGVGASTYTIGAATTTGTINIGGVSQTGALNIGTSSANHTVSIALGTGFPTLNLGTGNGGAVVNIGSINGTTEIVQRVGTGNFILSGVGASTYAIGTTTTTGTITIGGTSQTGTLTIGGGAQTGTLNIGVSSGAIPINIGNGTGNSAVNIGNGAGNNSVVVGSSSGSSSLILSSGTGGITTQGVAGVSVSNKNYVTLDTVAGLLGSDAGPTSGALVLIETQIASGLASLQFTTGITTAYNSYLLIVDQFQFSSAISSPYLYVQLSTDGGATYINSGYSTSIGDGSGLPIVPTTLLLTIYSSAQATLFNMTSGGNYITSTSTGTGIIVGNPASTAVYPISINACYLTDSILVNAIQVTIDGSSLWNADVALYGYVF